jgi:hypothetical protein
MPRAFAIGADRIFQDRRKEEVHNREQYYAKHKVVIPMMKMSNHLREKKRVPYYKRDKKIPPEKEERRSQMHASPHKGFSTLEFLAFNLISKGFLSTAIKTFCSSHLNCPFTLSTSSTSNFHTNLARNNLISAHANAFAGQLLGPVLNGNTALRRSL